MLAQVAAKHPLPEDPTLLQLLLGGPGLHEGAEERDQLPVLLGYYRGEDDMLHHQRGHWRHLYVSSLAETAN